MANYSTNDAAAKTVFLRLSSSEIRVLLALSVLNREGIVEIRGLFLSRILGISEKTVYRALSTLEKRGYIKRVKRPYRSSVIKVQWDKLKLDIPRVAEGSDTESHVASGEDPYRSKLPSIYVHTILSLVINRIGKAVHQRVMIPNGSYLKPAAAVIQRTANALKLNYAKVIISIFLADYYKSLNQNYKILYPAAWIARMGTIPDEELRIPAGFEKFLEERLRSLEEEDAQIELSFPPDDDPRRRRCPLCGEWILDRKPWGLDKHMRHTCRARPRDETPDECPTCSAPLPRERDAALFHMERCRLRRRMEEIVSGRSSDMVTCSVCRLRVRADLYPFHLTHECQPERWSCSRCGRRLPPSREEMEWHLSLHDLIDGKGERR